MNMDCFYKIFSSLDFSFAELILSTFFGFGSALLVEAIIDNHKEKNIRKQLIRDLKKELSSLKENIKMLEPDKVYIQPYTIPIWKGARECGSILCMDKESYFWKILEVYSSIDEANLVERKCFELYVGKDSLRDKELIISTLSNNREYVKQQIDKGLFLLEGG